METNLMKTIVEILLSLQTAMNKDGKPISWMKWNLRLYNV